MNTVQEGSSWAQYNVHIAAPNIETFTINNARKIAGHLTEDAVSVQNNYKI